MPRQRLSKADKALCHRLSELGISIGDELLNAWEHVTKKRYVMVIIADGADSVRIVIADPRMSLGASMELMA